MRYQGKRMRGSGNKSDHDGRSGVEQISRHYFFFTFRKSHIIWNVSCLLPPKVTNIHRVAVGIGPNINQLELEAITGDKNKVIMVDSFKSLHKHLENISQIANGKSFLSCSSAAPLQEPGYSSLGNSVTHFVPENGDRPESPNFLILLTDGNTRRQSRSIPRSLNPHANHIFM